MASSPLFSAQRVPGLDLMRGVNIVSMVIFHFSLLYYATPVNLYARVVFDLGALVGPLFLYLAGAGVWFFLQRYAPSRLFKRGVFLVLFTLLIGVVIKQRFYFEWTLIQDIGVAYLVMAIMARLTRKRFVALLIFYLGVLGVTWWTNAWLAGEFPFVIFAPYFMAGYGFCALCPTTRASSRVVLAWLGLACGLLVAGWLAGWLVRDFVAHFLVEVIGRIGVLMIVHFIAVYGLRCQRFDGWLGGTLVMLGHISLTSYYIQQVTLRVLQRIDFHPVILSPEFSHILLTSLMLVLMWTILKIWQRFNYVFSLEWMMRRL